MIIYSIVALDLTGNTTKISFFLHSRNDYCTLLFKIFHCQNLQSELTHNMDKAEWENSSAAIPI